MFSQNPNKQESTQVVIDIPDILKSRLEDDYTAVSIKGKVSVESKFRNWVGRYGCCICLLKIVVGRLIFGSTGIKILFKSLW
jgi:hypothetical protein